MSTKTKTTAKASTQKKEFNLERLLVLWRYKSKKGNVYFSGKTEEGAKVSGFYNKDKQNPKEPDIKLYFFDDEGNLEKDPFLAMWCNATTKDKKYLSGKYEEKRVVGFINEKSEINGVKPYINVYFSDDQEEQKPEKEEKPKFTKKETKFEEVEDIDDLPF